ncbi:hypothetical protein, partial [Brachybacterium sp. HMSC06H03]|uniref:hypothetical protein n=1 Tax=Brachybacterium sp. HMSC06H03 TaxID=1581127 RepID=UPI001FEDC729
MLEVVNDQGEFEIEETGSRIRRATDEWYSFRWNDVTSVRGETRTVRRVEREDWGALVTTRTSWMPSGAIRGCTRRAGRGGSRATWCEAAPGRIPARRGVRGVRRGERRACWACWVRRVHRFRDRTVGRSRPRLPGAGTPQVSGGRRPAD